MTQTEQKIRSELEDWKVRCPSCPLPHNLSSREVEFILSVYRQGVEEGKSYIGNAKREAYQMGYREGVEVGRREANNDTRKRSVNNQGTITLGFTPTEATYE